MRTNTERSIKLCIFYYIIVAFAASSVCIIVYVIPVVVQVFSVVILFMIIPALPNMPTSSFRFILCGQLRLYLDLRSYLTQHLLDDLCCCSGANKLTWILEGYGFPGFSLYIVCSYNKAVVML